MAESRNSFAVLRGGRQDHSPNRRHRPSRRRVSRWCGSSRKRALDLLLAGASLPLILPLIGGLALVSAIRFRCNPFFVQERAGLGEVPFRVTKIRSLRADFPEVGKHRLDQRSVCAWGRFLRRTHMDELPQIFNVLDGSMSMVGPRPMIPEVLDELSAPDRKERARVRPGLTGVWQVTTAGGEPLHDCAWLDARYVENGSLATDLRVLTMTVTGFMGEPSPTPEELVVQFGWRSAPVVQLAV